MHLQFSVINMLSIVDYTKYMYIEIDLILNKDPSKDPPKSL